MKILAVSDVVVDRLYTPQVAQNFRDLDLILGCGDLPYEYLEFLVSSLNVPLAYVPGNHDPFYIQQNPATQAEGCLNLDMRVAQIKGLILAGLGGSIRYKPDHPNQYTQAQMYGRFISLAPSILLNRCRTGRVLDIMVCHSPPRGIHDDVDLPHNGFSALRDLIRVCKPRYLLHGHTLVYKSNLAPAITRVDETLVINVYPYRILEVEAHVR